MIEEELFSTYPDSFKKIQLETAINSCRIHIEQTFSNFDDKRIPEGVIAAHLQNAKNDLADIEAISKLMTWKKKSLLGRILSWWDEYGREPK